MAKKMTKAKKIELRNKFILVIILCCIAFAIYWMVIYSIKQYEKKMMDYKVGVSETYNDAMDRQLKSGAVVSNGVVWKKAKRTDIDRYMKPDDLYKDPVQQYQFLNLSMSQKIHPGDLNELLKGKGILDGLGTTFAKAGKIEDINEIYLVNHALLETGKGKSELAKGVKVDGKKYYNFFGIGAYDRNPVKEGAKFAYEHGWDTPEKAVMGGAQFIKQEYLERDEQYTLYGMRFNPADPGKHQYATDVRWAHHNASSIARDYRKLGLKGRYFTRYYYKNHAYVKQDKVDKTIE